MGLGAGEAVNTVFDAFPELIQRALEAAGITQGSIMAQVQDKTDSIAEAITDALTGCRYDRAAVLDALRKNGIDGAVYQISAADMAALIAARYHFFFFMRSISKVHWILLRPAIRINTP